MTGQNPDTELQSFLDSIYLKSHSDRSMLSYRVAITNKNQNGFREYIRQKYNCNEIKFVEKVKKDEIDVFRALQDFVIFLDKKGYMPKSIDQRFTSVKGYLRHLGLKLYSEDVKHKVRLPKIKRNREEPLSKDMIRRVLANLPPKLQTVVLVLSSSGLRIGELTELTIADIDFESKPTKINVRAETTKTSDARETYLTQEATNSLKDYLRRYFDWKENSENIHLIDTKLFGRTSIIKTQRKKEESDLILPSSYTAANLLAKTLANSISKVPGLDGKNKSNGRRIVHYHALRKFFRTTLGNVAGRDYAEALMGRRFYMDMYYNMPSDERRKKYLEAEPHLTISDTKTVEKNLNKISAKHEELENKVDKLMAYLQKNSIQVPANLLSK